MTENECKYVRSLFYRKFHQPQCDKTLISLENRIETNTYFKVKKVFEGEIVSFQVAIQLQCAQLGFLPQHPIKHIFISFALLSFYSFVKFAFIPLLPLTRASLTT